MIAGMDFGTTNSGMACYDGRRLQPIPIGPAQAGLQVDRTALYVTNDQSIYSGQAAIDRYLEQNVGRPVKMERVRVGTLEVVAADMVYYRDVYAEKDVLSPGRLFLSFKTFLASVTYQGTMVGNLLYSLEDIVSTYLSLTKARAERFLDREIEQIVLGRPVVFSGEAQADERARERLVSAALRAGYKKVYLQYEPVAAAFQYETSLAGEQIVLVFDFGGGTLDVTVMRVGNPKTRQVLATGGIPVAGDVFDQRIVRRRLAHHFGEGSTYGTLTGRLPMPGWIYDALADWQSIMSLHQAETMAMLQQILTTSDRPRGIGNLIELTSKNHGLALYTAVEAAKRALSSQTETTIAFAAPDLVISERLDRGGFETLIHEEIMAIEGLLEEVMHQAGLSASAIDAVIRTGGSSEIPVFVEMLNRMFGRAKVLGIDVFSSVTSGLAVAAHRIETGELEAEAYSRDGQPSALAATNPSGVPPVDPVFLNRWVIAQEQAAMATARRLVVTRLLEGNRLLVTELSEVGDVQRVPFALEPFRAGALPTNQATLAGVDDRLLLVTSSYRLLLTTPRRIGVLREAGLDVPRIEQFERGETICTLDAWGEIRGEQQLAVVTSYGFVRLLEMQVVRGRVERAIPFGLGKRDESYPVAVFGMPVGGEIAVVTSFGRALRINLAGAPFLGLQAIKRDKGERIVACLAIREGDELLLMAADGTARVVPAAQVPLAEGPNTRARMVAGRLELRCAAILDPAASMWAVTSQALRPLHLDGISRGAAGAGKPLPLLRLEAGEVVIALVRGEGRGSMADADPSAAGDRPSALIRT